jgi:serine phosphatase RsbU (regulator of sigma subunit)
MSSPKQDCLLACGNTTAVEELCRQLGDDGWTIKRHTLGSGEPADWSAYDLVLVDDTDHGERALQFCRRLRASRDCCFVPLLFMARDQAGCRTAAYEAGADACLGHPFAPGELQAQAKALLRIKQLHDRLENHSAETRRINKQLQSSHTRIHQELELARRIQLSLLPQTLPDLPGVRFAVRYRPCGRVGGDFYDVFRLDEHHVGFYIADAMGHGIPASLLTMYLKKAVRGKEIFGNQYRLIPPDEVLQVLNRDLVEQALAENPFITMIYVLFNFHEGVLQYARAGHPHPLFLPSAGELQLWQAPGSLLGVFETTFTTQTQHLRPGDKVLFYTDGTDRVSFDGHAAGAESLIAAAARHRGLPVAELVDRLSHDLFHQTDLPDDFTLLALEFRE